MQKFHVITRYTDPNENTTDVYFNDYNEARELFSLNVRYPVGVLSCLLQEGDETLLRWHRK